MASVKSSMEQNRAPQSADAPKCLPAGWKWMLPLFILVGCFTFSSGIMGVFLYDDIKEIAENPNISQLWPITTPLFSANKLPVRPIPYLTFALNYALHGDAVEGYHYVNIAIHLLTGIVLFWALWQTFLRTAVITGSDAFRAEILAFCCIMIWLVHPLQTQAVTYIYQRMEQLMSLFFALTWATFILAVQLRNPTYQKSCFILSACCCLLGTLSKEVMVVVPVFILWYDRVFFSNSWQEIIKQRWGYYSALCSCWIALGMLINFQADMYPESYRVMPSRFEYLMTQSQVLTHYLKLVFYPRGLCFEYGWPVVRDFSQVWLRFSFICGMVLGTLYLMLRFPAWGFLTGSFFLFLGPTSSINPVLAPAFEHRMYLSLLSICVISMLLVNYFLERISASKPNQSKHTMLMLLVCFLIICPLSYLSHTRCKLYGSFESIWQDTLQKVPHSHLPHYMLGHYYDEQGDPLKALPYCQKAVELDPTDPDGKNNYGLCLLQLNRLDEAEKVFVDALKFNPEHLETLNNLGTIYGMQQKLPQAEQTFKQIIKLDPLNLGAKINLVRLNLIKGDNRAAEAYLQEVFRIDPTNFQAIVLQADLLLQQNKLGQAKKIIDYLIQHYPDHPETVRLRSQ